MVKRYGLTLLLLLSFCGVLFAVIYAMQTEDQAFSYETLEYEISPRFREFYEQLGGVNTLGIGISNIFTVYDKEYQYVVGGLMRFDPSLPDGNQFSLSAVGNEMGINQSVYATTSEFYEGPFRNGYPIYNEFVEMYYSRFEGPKYAGEPLTGPILDDQSQRTIQYFENVGFYFNESDPDHIVRLLPYGVWYCKDNCLTEGSIDPLAIVSGTLTRDTLFDLEVTSYAGLSGEKLTSVSYTPDGNVEQIYENIVLVADPGNLEDITLKPLAVRLGYKMEAPVAPTTIENHRFVFTSNDLGFHVNENVHQYLENFGGSSTFGEPIQQPWNVTENIWQQCFETLCLEYLSDGSDIRILPLGTEYFYQQTREELDSHVFVPLIRLGSHEIVATEIPVEEVIEPVENTGYDQINQENGIEIRTWNEKDLITSAEGQIIRIGIFVDGEPVDGVNTEITINLPGGIIHKQYPSITSNGGITNLNLEPIDAPNGTRIEYSVCLLGAGSDSLCVQDDFLIWDNTP